MKDKNIVIIDSSYYNFYRFFATLIWYNYSPERKEEAIGVSWINNPIFMTTYEKKWFENIHKICKQFKVKESDLIFARDGSNAWRYSIYPAYKHKKYIESPFNNNRRFYFGLKCFQKRKDDIER